VAGQLHGCFDAAASACNQLAGLRLAHVAHAFTATSAGHTNRFHRLTVKEA